MCLWPSTKLLYINCNCNPVGYGDVCARTPLPLLLMRWDTFGSCAHKLPLDTLSVAFGSISGKSSLAKEEKRKKKLGTFAKKETEYTPPIMYTFNSMYARHFYTYSAQAHTHTYIHRAHSLIPSISLCPCHPGIQNESASRVPRNGNVTIWTCERHIRIFLF